MKFLVLVTLLFSAPAFAILPAPKRDGKTGIGLMSDATAGTNDYRIGDEWGKRPVTDETLKSASPVFRRAALATAHAGGATSFYLGKFRGMHVMATNYHVFSYEGACLGNRITFPLLNITATCETFLGSWNAIDLALFTIRLNPADEAKLEAVAGNFDFADDVRPGETLLTIGFGVAGNSGHQLMANQDSDCYVFSGAGEYRQMADPDEWNPGPYRAWSFSLGCDVSHGDSGSAIVDRESGKVVGIIWTGKIPKNPAAQSSRSLDEMFRSRSEAIWTELSYAVPAKKMGEHLRSILGSLSPEKREIVEAILN